MDEQEGTEDVDLVLPVEIGNSAVLDGEVLGYTGVIDENVNLELAALGVREVVLCCVYYVCWTGWDAHVCFLVGVSFLFALLFGDGDLR